MEGFPWDRQSPHERRFGMSYRMMAKPSHEIDISYILPSQCNSISVPFLKMGLEEKVFRNPLINMCALIHVRWKIHESLEFTPWTERKSRGIFSYNPMIPYSSYLHFNKEKLPQPLKSIPSLWQNSISKCYFCWGQKVYLHKRYFFMSN